MRQATVGAAQEQAPSPHARRLDAVGLGACLLTLGLGLAAKARFHVNLEEFREVAVFDELTHGKVLYRDVDWIYGPLMPALYLGWASQMGNNLLSLRYFSIVVICVIAVLVYALSLRLTGNRWLAGTATLLSQWQIRFPTYAYAHFVAACLVLVSFVCVFTPGLFRQEKTRWLLAGIASGLAVVQQPVFEGGAALVWTALFLGLSVQMSQRRLSIGLRPKPLMAYGAAAGITVLLASGVLALCRTNLWGLFAVQREIVPLHEKIDYLTRFYFPLRGYLERTLDHVASLGAAFTSGTLKGLWTGLVSAVYRPGAECYFPIVRETLLCQAALLGAIAGFRKRLRPLVSPLAALVVWSVFVDLRGAHTQYMQYVFIAFIVLIGLGLAALQRRFGWNARHLSAGAFVLVLLMVLGTTEREASAQYVRLPYRQTGPVYLERYAAEALEQLGLRLRTREEDVVALGYFWFPAPQLAGLEQRLLGRYHGFDLILSGKPRGRSVVQELEMIQPAWLVVSRPANYSKQTWKTLILSGDPCLETSVPAVASLRRLLRDHYVFVEEINSGPGRLYWDDPAPAFLVFRRATSRDDH